MRSRTAMVCLLVEAGASLSKARHFAKWIDTVCVNGWSCDDLAALLLNWSNQRMKDRLLESDAQIKRLQGIVADPDQLVLPWVG